MFKQHFIRWHADNVYFSLSEALGIAYIPVKKDVEGNIMVWRKMITAIKFLGHSV